MNRLPHATARVRALTVAMQGLCRLPDLLVGVDGYRDRLAALIKPTRGDPVQES
jgi:hypothetical protein